MVREIVRPEMNPSRPVPGGLGFSSVEMKSSAGYSRPSQPWSGPMTRWPPISLFESMTTV